MVPHMPESVEARLFMAFLKFRHTPWHKVPGKGLSQVETDILDNILRANRRGKIPRVSDISLNLRVSSPTVTQHLNHLEGQGFVERTPSTEDKRSVQLSLTDKGNEVLKSHREKMEEDFTEFIGLIGEEQAEMMIALFESAQDFFTYKAKMREIENLSD